MTNIKELVAKKTRNYTKEKGLLYINNHLTELVREELKQHGYVVEISDVKSGSDGLKYHHK